MSRTLTKRQLDFVFEYIKDMNARRAAKAAGMAEDRGPHLLRNNKAIVAEVDRQMKKQLGVFKEPTQERILIELMRIAFFDPAKLFDNRGNPLPLSMIDEDTRRCIAGIKFSVEGKGEDAEVIKEYKVIDKHKALENLGRYLAMFTDKMKIDVPTELEKMTDDQLRSTALELAKAAGLTISLADTAETKH